MALPLPRVIPDKDIQQNFDELANQFPIQSVNIAPAGVKATALGTLVIPVTAAANYTISGLNGDTDIAYEFYVIGSGTGYVAQAQATIAPNGTTTNQTTLRHGNEGPTGVSHSFDAVTPAGMAFAQVHSTAYTVHARGTLGAKTGQGSYRSLLSQSTGIRNSDAYGYNYTFMSRWTETTTNITSLVFNFGGTGTFTGTIILRKLGY